ncbi:MAG: SGNH/GDSL hydrolase family protein [Verrucomicrobia bacterium]|nr:SGNH/GDSL hydrolase family protein [Verrucomicrobiota bacterium]
MNVAIPKHSSAQPLRHGIHSSPPSSPGDRVHEARSWGLLKAGDSILFIGDSITDAFRKPEEINIAYQLGAGYALMIGARLMAELPGAGFHFSNRGISGQRVTHLAERWEHDCLDLAPSVVSLLAGVNSTLERFKNGEAALDASFEGFGEVYDTLIMRLISRHPAVRLILCEPFLLPCGIGTPDMLEDIRVRADSVRRLAEKYNATFVPFQSAFDEAVKRAPAEYWAYDGIHPTAAGFWLLAETWLNHVVRSSGNQST